MTSTLDQKPYRSGLTSTVIVPIYSQINIFQFRGSKGFWRSKKCLKSAECVSTSEMTSGTKLGHLTHCIVIAVRMYRPNNAVVVSCSHYYSIRFSFYAEVKHALYTTVSLIILKLMSNTVRCTWYFVATVKLSRRFIAFYNEEAKFRGNLYVVSQILD